MGEIETVSVVDHKFLSPTCSFDGTVAGHSAGSFSDSEILGAASADSGAEVWSMERRCGASSVVFDVPSNEGSRGAGGCGGEALSASPGKSISGKPTTFSISIHASRADCSV